MTNPSLVNSTIFCCCRGRGYRCPSSLLPPPPRIRRETQFRRCHKTSIAGAALRRRRRKKREKEGCEGLGEELSRQRREGRGREEMIGRGEKKGGQKSFINPEREGRRDRSTMPSFKSGSSGRRQSRSPCRQRPATETGGCRLLVRERGGRGAYSVLYRSPFLFCSGDSYSEEEEERAETKVLREEGGERECSSRPPFPPFMSSHLLWAKQ